MASKIIRPLKSGELERHTGRHVSVRKVTAIIKRHRLSTGRVLSWAWVPWSLCVGGCSGQLEQCGAKLLLDTCVYFFNYRTHTVGLNQIKTVYDPLVDTCILNYKLSHDYEVQNNTVY